MYLLLSILFEIVKKIVHILSNNQFGVLSGVGTVNKIYRVSKYIPLYIYIYKH